MTLLRGHRHQVYTEHPTPLERLDRLSAWLGGSARIWIKRDDRTGLALGGNKTRKLEYLVADALDRGCDTLITCGSVQSNHCRLTAAAAAHEGLDCHLVIREKKPDQYDPDGTGNHLLYRLLGCEIHVRPPGTDLSLAMAEVARKVREAGGHPYVIPMGGSNAIGAMGYVRCAEELIEQVAAQGLTAPQVLCASSSGGTQAGLVVGLAPAEIPVHGISVDLDAQTQRIDVVELVRLASAAVGKDPPGPAAVRVYDQWVGPGYAEPTEEMVEAVRAFARLEGVILDPVYTGKAAAGLVALVRAGRFDDQDVVFVHTGGAPALFALPDPTVPVLPR